MDRITGTWIITQDAQTARSVTGALTTDKQLGPVRQCDSLTALADSLKQEPAPVVVVDIDPNPSKTLETLQPIIDEFTNTRFVVLANQRDNDTVMEAMHAGARHFCTKQSIASELRPILHRLAANGSGRTQTLGSSVTVLSAGGGCGATTLSINLASELELLGSKSTLLVDLDTRYGGIATHLGLSGGYGIADVLARDEPVDHELVQTSTTRHQDRLDVLLSPVSVNYSDPTPLCYERIDEAIKACRCGYDWTVIDAASVPMDVAAYLADTSCMTLVVFQLTVKDVRTARSIMEALADRGVPQHRLMPVANRYRRRRLPFSLDEAQKALGGHRPHVIRNDYRSAVNGINYGLCLNRVAPRSRLRRDVATLARELFDSVASPIT